MDKKIIMVCMRLPGLLGAVHAAGLLGQLSILCARPPQSGLRIYCNYGPNEAVCESGGYAVNAPVWTYEYPVHDWTCAHSHHVVAGTAASTGPGLQAVDVKTRVGSLILIFV